MRQDRSGFCCTCVEKGKNRKTWTLGLQWSLLGCGWHFAAMLWIHIAVLMGRSGLFQDDNAIRAAIGYKGWQNGWMCMKMMRGICHGLHGSEIWTQLITRGRFDTTVLAITLQNQHQSVNEGIAREQMVFDPIRPCAGSTPYKDTVFPLFSNWIVHEYYDRSILAHMFLWQLQSVQTVRSNCFTSSFLGWLVLFALCFL